MARTGETIENPLTGERITFLETAGETDGESLKFEYILPPGFSIPEHIHPKQEERHEIVSGTLRGSVAGRERDYEPGQKVIGPAGVPHAWRNPSDDEELLIVSELRPALRFEPLMETYFALSRDLKRDKRSVPGHLMRLAILVDESKNDFYSTGMPMVAWRAFMVPFAALARVAGLFGYGVGDSEPVRIEHSVVVSGTPEEIFAFAGDPRNDPLWSSSIEEVRQISEGTLGVGTEIRTVAHFLGRRIETPEKVTEYEPNHKLSLKVNSGPLRFTGSRSVEAVAGGTRITFTIEGRSGGFFGVADPVFARLAGRTLKADISNLKDILEGRPPAPKVRGKTPAFLVAGLAGAVVLVWLRRRSEVR
ncbi:MAG: SRPBCC family protein [Rubrobacteraceae bacterium]